MRRVSLVFLALVCALLLTIPAALAKSSGSAATPGISAKIISIGGTFPLTGPASSYAPIPAGMKAYFAYINSRKGPDGKRGVYGRQIAFKYYDDGYNPANSIQLTRKLVEDDKVFAVVGSLGTEVNQAIQPYLNAAKVPHVLVSTGASEFGTNWKTYPWTIGWQPDYVAEARLYGLDVKAKHQNDKIAVMYQNDSYGKDYFFGFRAALGKTLADKLIVSQEAFDVTNPSVTSTVLKMKASGANVLMIFVTPTPTIKTYATIKAVGWKPDQIYVNSVSATATFMGIAVASSSAATVNGSISTGYLKDPASPTWAKDPAVKEYYRLMTRFLPSGKQTNGLYLYGFAKAETFVQAMYKAGKNPTRQGLMDALLSMNSTTNRFTLPGVKQKTSKTDHFIISQQQTIQYGDGQWAATGKLTDGRPRG